MRKKKEIEELEKHSSLYKSVLREEYRQKGEMDELELLSIQKPDVSRGSIFSQKNANFEL